MSNYLVSRDTTLVMSQNLAPAQLYSIYFDFLDVINGVREYRDFEPSEAVSPERLSGQGIHVRVYGLVTQSSEPESPFPRSFGYTKAKSLRPETAYQSFNVRQVDHRGQTYIEIEATSGGGILATSLGGNSGLEFLRIRFRPEEFRPGSLEMAPEDGQARALFAYRGRKSQGATGESEECLLDVIDRSRSLNLQIDWEEGTSINPGTTLKFLGNLPLKPLSMASVPEELDDTPLKICR
jgi:hypothetical protein